MLLRHLRPHLRVASLAFVSAALLVDFSDAAQAVARTPTISGNSWVALLIIGVLVVVIYMLIRGTLHVESRDARMFGGGGRRRDNGWYGIFPARAPDDEEDAPDYHHHHNGSEGGGEGG